MEANSTFMELSSLASPLIVPFQSFFSFLFGLSGNIFLVIFCFVIVLISSFLTSSLTGNKEIIKKRIYRIIADLDEKYESNKRSYGVYSAYRYRYDVCINELRKIEKISDEEVRSPLITIGFWAILFNYIFHRLSWFSKNFHLSLLLIGILCIITAIIGISIKFIRHLGDYKVLYYTNSLYLEMDSTAGTNICDNIDCSNIAHADGLCVKHYLFKKRLNTFLELILDTILFTAVINYGAPGSLLAAPLYMVVLIFVFRKAFYNILILIFG